MKDSEFIEYLGGFFDADGSVYWMKNNGLNLNFTQSEKTILDKINAFYDDSFRMTSNIAKNNQRQVYLLNSNGSRTFKVLKELGNSCIIKNPQVNLGLEYLRYLGIPGFQEERERIGSKIKFYNRNKYDEEYINLRPYDKINTRYLAGMFDGDGSVSLTTRGYYLKITQTSDRLLLKKINELYPLSKYKDGSNDVMFYSQEAIQILLLDLLPYLIYKKQQAEDLLAYFETNNTQERKRLVDSVIDAKKFDLDPEKYKQEIIEIFKDLEKNYTYKELLLYKKSIEISETRKVKTIDSMTYNKLDIKDIDPELIFCETRQQQELWLYYKKKTSIVTHNNPVGRNVRILVRDKTTMKYIGVMSLGSDIYNMTCRDNYVFTETGKNTQEYINYIANLNCCVPLQPFGYNYNGGKLLVKLAFSKEVQDYWVNKYKQPLLCITTMGLNGKSIMYDRLKEFKLVGYTNGEFSTLHIPDIVYKKCKILFNYFKLDLSRMGRANVIEELFHKTGIKQKFTEHIVKKSCYVGWVFKSKFNTLHPNENLKTVKDITQEWLVRWSNRKNIKKRTGVELLDDSNFINIKQYKLPTSYNIDRRTVEKEEIQKIEKTDRILKASKDQYLSIFEMKFQNLTTQEAADELKRTFGIVYNRNEISKIWLGEAELPTYIKQTEEYKNMINYKKLRTYNKPKTELQKQAVITANNLKRTITDEIILKILREKKTAHSAELCGKNQQVLLSRTTVQKIWSGQQRVLGEFTQEMQDLVNYKRSRKV